MATGRSTGEGGGVLAQEDVRGAGEYEWGNLIGIQPDHPLVGGKGVMPYDSDYPYSRIVTTPAGQSGAASGGGLAATPDGYKEGPGYKQLDDWRDLFNLKGSPMPYLLLLALGVILFAHASIRARGGAFGKGASAAAAFN